MGVGIGIELFVVYFFFVSIEVFVLDTECRVLKWVRCGERWSLGFGGGRGYEISGWVVVS